MKRSMISLLVVGMLSGNAMAATFTLKSGSTLTEEQANTIISNFYSDTSTENFLAIKNNFNIPDEYASSALSFYNQYARVYQSTVEKFSNLFEKPVVVVDTHAPAADVHLGSSGETSSGNTGSTEVVMPDGLTEHKETGVITQKDIDDKQTAAIQNVTRGIVAVDGKVEDLEKHVETIDGAVKDNTDAIHQLGDTVTSHIDDSNQRITSIENDVNTKASQAEVDTLTHTVETNKQELTSAIDTKADQSAVDHSVDSLMVRNSLLHKKVGSLLNGQAETLTEVEQLRSDTHNAIQALTAQVVVNTGTIHGVPEASKESFEYAHSVLGDAQAALGSILAGKNVGQVEAPAPVNPSGQGGLTVGTSTTTTVDKDYVDTADKALGNRVSAAEINANTAKNLAETANNKAQNALDEVNNIKTNPPAAVNYIDAFGHAPEEKSLSNEFGKIDTRITKVENTLTNKADKSDVTTLTNSVNLQAGQISTITRTANSANALAESNKLEINGLDNTVSNLGMKVDSLVTSVDSKADKQAVISNINYLQKQIDTKVEQKDIDAAIASVNAVKKSDVDDADKALQSQIDTNAATINNLNMKVDSNSVNIDKAIVAETTAREDADTAIKVDVAQNAKDINSVKTQVTANTDSITKLTSTVASQGGQIHNIQNVVNSVNKDLTGKIATNTASITKNADNIKVVTSKVGDVQTNLDNAVVKLNGEVVDVKTTADKAAGDIVALSAKDTDLQKQIDTKADTAAVDTKIALVKSSLQQTADHLGGNITKVNNALTTEVSDRKKADSELVESVEKEKDERKLADEAIDKKVATYAGAIANNAGNISSNTSAITTLTGSVASVKTTAEEAKKTADALSNSVDTATQHANQAINEVGGMKDKVNVMETHITGNREVINSNAAATNRKFAEVDNTLGNHEVRIDNLESKTNSFEQQVKKQGEQIAANDKKAMAGVASAMAMSSMHYTGNINSMAFAVGKYDSGSAVGIGYEHKLSDNAQANVQASYDSNGKVGVSAGVAFGW